METAVYSDCMWCELSFAVLRISCPQPLAKQHLLSFSRVQRSSLAIIVRAEEWPGDEAMYNYTFHVLYMYKDVLFDDMYQLMIHTCSNIPVYCVYQNTHSPSLSSSLLLFSPPLRNIAPFLSTLQP